MKKYISILVFTSFSLFTLAQNTWQVDLLAQVNATRIKGCRCGNKYYAAAPPLIWNNTLETAANKHAIEMDKKRYFSHTSRNGNGFAERIEAAGYNWERCGENIANGQVTVNEVVVDWFKSPSHCKNIMNPEYKEVGTARSSNYWVQDFGTLLNPLPKKK